MSRSVRSMTGPSRAIVADPGGGCAVNTLPTLLDRKTLGEELGVTRAVVDAIFRSVPVVALPGLRKPMVRREDVLRLLEESTYRDGERIR